MRNYSELLTLIKDADALVFDLDGTISATEYLHWEAYNTLLKEYGVRLDNEHILKYIGRSEVEIYAMINSDFSINIDSDRFFDRRISTVKSLIHSTDLRPFDYFTAVKTAFGGAKDFYLLTSQVPELVDFLLTYWGLDDLFPLKCRYCAHDGKITKFSVLSSTQKYFGVPQNSVAVFEDSDAVLTYAKSLGIKCIGVEHKLNCGKLTAYDYKINVL